MKAQHRAGLRRVFARRRHRAVVAGVATSALVALAVQSGLWSAEADTDPPPGTPETVTVDWLPTWQINGVVWSQAIVGNTVYATGNFTKARPPGTSPGSPQEVDRLHLLAYDITTGNLITSFNHSLNAQGLRVTKSPDGSRIYVGGDFTTVDGVTRNHLAAFDTATGALVTTFAPNVSAQVRAITATNSTVYFGGNFFNVNGFGRTRLAAVSASTGANVQTWRPTADDNEVWTMVLAPDNSRVIVGGRFTTLNTQPAYGMGSVDTATGASMPWAANTTIRDAAPSGAITSLLTDGTQIYGAGFAYGGASQFEGTFAADPNTGQINWLNDCHGDTYEAYPIGQVLYNVSHTHDCSAIGLFPDTNPRKWYRGMATTTYPNGVNYGPDTYGWNYNGWPASEVLHWFPILSPGTFTGQGQAGWSVVGNSSYISIGGEFPRVEGLSQQGLVRYAIKTIAPNNVGPKSELLLAPTATVLPGGIVRVGWRSTWDQDNVRLTYDVFRDGNPTPVYTTVGNSAFWNLPALAYLDEGLTLGTAHTYTVRATDPWGNSVTSPVSNSVTAATVQPSAYRDEVLGDGPTSYWRLGEPSGTNGYDYAGSNDLTTNSGVTRNVTGALVGDPDRATTFNGTSSGTAASLYSVPPPKGFSIEAWVRTSSTVGGRIIGYSRSRTGTSSAYDRHLYMTNNGRVVFGVNPGPVRTIESASGLNNNQWHHVVGTLSPTTGMKLFVDGVQVASDASVTGGQNFFGYWRLGGDNLNGWPSRPTSNNLNGTIDDAAVYSSALSAAQVASHNGVGRGTVVPNDPPTAAFTSSCTFLACTFDGSGSSDSDGTITSYAWDFGDGGTGTGVSPSHTFPGAGDYVVGLTVTDDDGDSDTVNHTVSVTSQVLASDTFTRTVGGGFGNADVGGPWTSTGTASALSVDGSAAKVVLGTPGTGPGAYLQDVSSTDADVSVTVSSDKEGTGNGIYFKAAGRRIVGVGEYRAVVRLRTAGAVGLYITRTDAAGVETTIGTELTVAGLTYGPGTVLRVRTEVTGTSPTTIRAKVWIDGTAEPGWLVTQTDSTAALQAAGGVGLRTQLSGSATNAPVTLTVDNFTAVRP